MTTSRLTAFHGDASIKDKYLCRVRAHRAADEIINGRYWENGKGCAVGCTVHSSRHEAYQEELGIPRVLAQLEDRLFESLFLIDPVVAKECPERFLSVIQVGADLSLVWSRFALWLLSDETGGVIKFAETESRLAASHGVSALFQRWLNAYAEPYAGGAARRDAYLRMAEKLIELLKAA